jgi:hypothetical protein
LRCLDIYQESTTEGEMEMAIDLRDTDTQRDRSPIPDGVYCLKIAVKGGSADRNDCLRWAKNGRSLLLHLECTVVGGDHGGRKLWDYITCDFDESDKDDAPPLEVSKLNDFRASVRMGRARLRAILDSAYSLQPNDHSEAADAKRQLESYEELDGLIFCAQVETRPPQGKYAARNNIEFIITPDLPDYRKPPADPAGKTIVQLKRTRAQELDDEIPY